MRYSEDHKAKTHGRIVDRAAALLRAHGVNGIGVADLMREAGLTHGGFYAHFDSKEALVAESVVAAWEQSIKSLRIAAQSAPPGKAIEAMVNLYLSEAHRAHPERGCPVAALGADISRLDAPTKIAFETKFEELVDLFASHLTSRGDRRAEAIGLLATLVGALTLARAANSKKLAKEILEDGRARALNR